MRTLPWTLLLIVACASGCRDTTAPLPFQPGTYAPSMWTYTEDGLTTDYIQDGGTLSITLDPNGQLSGTIELPPLHFPSRDSAALVIPVQGSYELGETSVRITAPGVPILNGIQLRFDGGSLAGSILLPGPQASVVVFSFRLAQRGSGADGQMGSNNAGRWADGQFGSYITWNIVSTT